jgi:hypothetical protein
MLNAILSTDMAIHFELLSKLTARLETGEPLKKEDKEDRAMLINILLHAADISNLCRPYELSRHWSDCLHEEFLAQVFVLFLVSSFPFFSSLFLHPQQQQPISPWFFSLFEGRCGKESRIAGFALHGSRRFRPVQTHSQLY